MSGIRHDVRSKIMNSNAFSGADRSRVVLQPVGKVAFLVSASAPATTALATCRPVNTNRPH